MIGPVGKYVLTAIINACLYGMLFVSRGGHSSPSLLFRAQLGDVSGVEALSRAGAVLILHFISQISAASSLNSCFMLYCRRTMKPHSGSLKRLQRLVRITQQVKGGAD